MNANDVCGKALMGITEWHVSITILQFLFRFLIITFYNTCYNFYSLPFFCHLLRFYFKVDLSGHVYFFSLVVIILLVYDGGWSGTVATSGAEVFVIMAKGFQSFPFVTGGFAWDVVAVLPLLLYLFSVN